ncbi:MAG: 3'-5' exonuclease [Robiginitalea sp.]
MKKWLSGIWNTSLPGKSTSGTTDISEVTFVVLDTETTGMDPDIDRILSIGALRLSGGRIRVRETLEIFIAQDHFDRRSVPIHGILRQGPNPRVSEKEALLQLEEYVGDAIIVGHHIHFDLEMLRRALWRHELPPLDNPILDTGILYKRTLLKSPVVQKKASYSLDELAHKFDLSCRDRHTALGDAYITALAFLKILTRLKEKRDFTLKQLLRMGG